MSDRELRELERRYLAHGDPEARELLIRARIRTGQIADTHLRLAHDLHDPLAIELLGPPPGPAPQSWFQRAARGLADRFDFPGVSLEALELGRWVQALEPHGADALAEASRCALSVARASWAALDEAWESLRGAETAPATELAAACAGECARHAARAVGAPTVREAIVQGLTDWALGLPRHHPAPARLLADAPQGNLAALPRLVERSLLTFWRNATPEVTLDLEHGLTPQLALHPRLREPYRVRLLFLAGLNPVRDVVAGKQGSFELNTGSSQPLTVNVRVQSTEVVTVTFGG